MDTEELRQKVESFERWHYQIDLGSGVVTPVAGTWLVNRATQRRRIFFDRILSVTYGTFRGMRILDLGCNAGYWSLQAIEAGADFVFGIDGRQMHIDQANLVFEAKGIDPSRYQFELGDFFDCPPGSFDLVLCLGVLYHVSSPVELFNLMAATGAELLVIDTEVSQLNGNLFVLHTESLDRYTNALQEEVVAYPTRGAIAMLAARHGYQAVALDIGCITDAAGMKHYLSGGRASFICSKGRSLDRLPRAPHNFPRSGSHRPLAGLASRVRRVVATGRT
jgi:tRNA (mo5U34)-methyltransferase